MERREFLKSAAAAGAGMAAADAVFAQSDAGAASSPHSPAAMQYRELGTTGQKVSAIGLGGFHVGLQADPAESIRLVRSAVDQGITFLDNCWDYNNGVSEVRMGQALRDGYRSRVFLMTKLDGRTREAYNQQLEQSLRRLQTETIDLVQFHEIIRLEDPDRIFAPGGAMEAAVAARQAGKIRYIGFTGHKDPIVHLRMLEVAQQHRFHFDTAQMPVNVMDAHFRSFTRNVVPVCVKQGIGVLAMKTMGDGFVLKSKTVQPIEALHFALQQPVSVVITGMDSPALVAQALQAIATYRPMSPAEMASLLARTKTAAESGIYEPFKTSNQFDGTAANPSWLG